MRYWNTIRYLEPGQILGRLWFRLAVPKLGVGPTPAARARIADWTGTTMKPKRAVGHSSFVFLNRLGVCETAADWNDSGREKLWLYNLHYFEDLVAAEASTRKDLHAELIDRWIRENQPTVGVGWESYPSSMRIVNWIKWAWSGNALPPGFDRSLALQARWLAQRVEHHLRANHLLLNAKALVFAGLYFEGAEADAWRQAGSEILSHELKIQILPDGGHFERSPMYHALITEDVLDLVNGASVIRGTIDATTVEGWRRTAEVMLGWLRALTHPDGEIAFFNDAAFGVAARLDDLECYARRLGVPLGDATTSPLHSGYVRIEDEYCVLIADVAPVGPDNQPAHAHADTLSYELSLNGQRVVVNSGTSTYQGGPQRQFERSTAAHNTLVVDAADSSEVWGAFRVARRARPREVILTASAGASRLSAAHDGYKRLPGRPMHRREWLVRDRSLRVTDSVEGVFRGAVSRHYLHPDIKPTDDALLLPDGTRCHWHVTGGRAVIKPAIWHPEFGLSVPNTCIEVTLFDEKTVFELAW